MVMTVPPQISQPPPDLVRLRELRRFSSPGAQAPELFAWRYLTLVVICAGICPLPVRASTQ